MRDGYDAPFPDERYQAGMRQFPSLIPLTPQDPAAAINRATWAALERFHRPFLTAFSDGDEASRGWAEVFAERVPGARGRFHPVVSGAGHFVAEDRAEEIAAIVAAFVAETPLGLGHGAGGRS